MKKKIPKEIQLELKFYILIVTKEDRLEEIS